MPELTLAPGLLGDTTNPEQLVVTLDPALVVTPAELEFLERKDQKGVPGGYAPLGADNLVPSEFLPAASGGGGSTLVPFFDARSYGALTANTDNQAAFQAAIDAAEAAGGGRVFVPAGVWNTGPLALGHRVWLEGASMLGTRLVLLGGVNADFVTNKLSADGVQPNAQFVAVSSLTLDGNLANNATSGRGVFFTQNPTSGRATNDAFVDPRMLLRDLFITNVRGNAYEGVGRSEITCHNVNVFFCGGYGFKPGADTFLNSCKSGATGKAGFYIVSPSVRVANSKAFFAGDSNFGTPTQGHGFHVSGTGRGVTLSNCEGQDNKAAGLRVDNSAHRTIVESFVADSNSKHGKGLYAGVEIGASRHCVITAVCCERNDPALSSGDANFCAQRYGLKLESGAVFNKIRLTHSATSGGPVVDEAIMPSANTAALLSQNDVSINAQGAYRSLTYAASWTPEPYSGSVIKMTLTGNTSVLATGTSVLSQAHAGTELELLFVQDATGGRTVTFASQYQVVGSVNTSGGALSVVKLRYDGVNWLGSFSSAGGGSVDTSTLTHTLTWNTASGLTNKYEPNPRPASGYYRYVGPTDPTTLGVTFRNGDTWEQTF